MEDHGTDHEAYTEHLDVVRFYLVVTVSPILILLGTVGNLLSVVVLVRLCRKSVSINMYLVCLAAADIIVLWSSCFRQLYIVLGGTDIRTILTMCKINVFTVYCAIQFSSWLQVAVTIARMVAVCSPFHLQNRCTTKTSAIVISCIFVTKVLVNLHFLVFKAEYAQTKFLPQLHQEYLAVDRHVRLLPRTLNYSDIWNYLHSSESHGKPETVT
jgi:hypothetical protein